MKILICSNVYPPAFIGGAELIAHQQAVALGSAGHEVQVFAGDIREGYPRHSLRTDTCEGITVHRNRLVAEDFDGGRVNFCHMAVEDNFRRILREFTPDIVHAHNLIGLSTKILRIAKEAGARIVVTLHDHWGYCLKNTAMVREGVVCEDLSACAACQSSLHDGSERNIPIRLRQDYFHNLPDEVDLFISPSAHLARSYLRAGFPSDKLVVNWNGVDFDRFSKPSNTQSSELRFTYVGYFGKHKGVATLLNSLPLIRERFSLRINLVGEGDQEQEYVRILESNKCIDLVKFWGKIQNESMTSVYAETDVLILPSVWPENQPVSITEAMCAGLPVIASRMGGMPELVKHGVTGLIFEAGNPVDLAEKMTTMIIAPELRKEMGENARTMMKLNSFRTQVSRLVALYERTQPPEDQVKTRTKILCVGERFSQDFLFAIDAVNNALPYEMQPRFLHHEWITETQLADFHLIWFTENELSEAGTGLLGRSVAASLLVPQSDKGTLAACKSEAVWFAYSDASEAAAAIIEFCKARTDAIT